MSQSQPSPKAFLFFDKDGDGYIMKEEVAQIMHEVRIHAFSFLFFYLPVSAAACYARLEKKTLKKGATGADDGVENQADRNSSGPRPAPIILPASDFLHSTPKGAVRIVRFHPTPRAVRSLKAKSHAAC